MLVKLEEGFKMYNFFLQYFKAQWNVQINENIFNNVCLLGINSYQIHVTYSLISVVDYDKCFMLCFTKYMKELMDLTQKLNA